MTTGVDKKLFAKEHARYAKSQGKIAAVYEKLHVWHLDEIDRDLSKLVRKELGKDYPLTPRLREV